MKKVQPRVFMIGRSRPERDNIQAWLDHIGANEYEVPEAGEVPDGSLLVQLAGKRCYMSFQVGLNPNITRVRTDLTAFIDNILKVGHGSVIEHVYFNFAIEGITRVALAELNRHRHLNISEGSLRFIRFEDIPYWEPESIAPNENDAPNLAAAKMKTRLIFEQAFQHSEVLYQQLEEIWGIGELKRFAEKKLLTSMFRRIIPMGVSSGGVWTGNFRALRHIFEMRCSPHAEEEICLIGSLLLDEMIAAEPDFFRDFEKVDGYWQPKYSKV